MTTPTSPAPTGADALIRAAESDGIAICFANPGTTEMPLVAALDRGSTIRVVLNLFEGVCTAAADGWGRMTGRPAATLLHLGPGFANGIANSHNARRARTPVVNWIGDHATWHLAHDAPLSSDIAALAGTLGWVHTIRSAGEMADAHRAAVTAAAGPPGRIASLIIPADAQWSPAAAGHATQHPDAATSHVLPPPPPTAPASPDDAARLLREGGAVLLLGGTALASERAQWAAARIAAATKCAVVAETFPARQERGRHVPPFPTLPYFPEQARQALAPFRSIVLAGAREPVGFFGYPGMPSRVIADGVPVCVLADPDAGDDAASALESLADALGAPRVPSMRREAPSFAPTGGAIDTETLGRTLAACTPEGAILVNEGNTAGLAWAAAHAAHAAPHTVLSLTGGSIGIGLPLALGASLAAPDRRVIAFQADGSAAYTMQALWSMAREGCDITIVLCANRRYRILQAELARAGITEPGAAAYALTDLTRPTIDWATIARGFGVRAESAQTDTELADAMRRAERERGPTLIEAVLV